jgi:hypothetical protein
MADQAPPRGSATEASGHDLARTWLCAERGCENEYPCSSHPHSRPCRPSPPPEPTQEAARARALLLGVLDAISRGAVDPASRPVAVVVAHDPVLGLHDPHLVLQAIRRTMGPRDLQERALVAAVLQRNGHESSDATLWLAELREEVIRPLPAQGLWEPDEYGYQVRFELSGDWAVIPSVMRFETSPVEARIRRLIALFKEIPETEEPWELMLNHGAGRQRPDFLRKHERREGISRHEADSDRRRATRRLIASGHDGTQTPLLVALRDGGDSAYEAKRLRRFRKRHGLPLPCVTTVLQGK